MLEKSTASLSGLKTEYDHSISYVIVILGKMMMTCVGGQFTEPAQYLKRDSGKYFSYFRKKYNTKVLWVR